jgi:DNA-directed RNA polymerase specialized sigma24 family protein
MAGILALMVADRDERLSHNANGKDAPKTEVLLAGAGLDAGQIAPLVGKNVPAVRKAIQRGRKTKTAARGRKKKG